MKSEIIRKLNERLVSLQTDYKRYYESEWNSSTEEVLDEINIRITEVHNMILIIGNL